MDVGLFCRMVAFNKASTPSFACLHTILNFNFFNQDTNQICIITGRTDIKRYTKWFCLHNLKAYFFSVFFKAP